MMRLAFLLAAVAACGSSDSTPDAGFVGNGGTLAIPGCGYSITTPIGAEAPQPSSSFEGADATPRLVHLGIVGDPKTSMVVQWRTIDETTRDGFVRFAVGADLSPAQLTAKLTGIEFGFKGIGSDVYRQHQAHLCGLTPGTAYSYQVGSVGADGMEHFSPVYTFHTAPDVVAHPDAEVVFGFVGDSRGGYDVWAMLVAQIQQRMPDLVLFSGDAVTVGITQFEWDDFFARGEPLFATTPLVAANGNHEANAVNYYAQVAMPGDQQNFGLDYGFAHITVANDTPDDPAAITGAFRDAIAADFTASDAARWKLFMHHQPMWSASTKHGSNLDLQAAWQPVVDAHHIDLVLNGHEHNYEITKPLVGANVATGAAAQQATVYVIAGGAGAELYPNGMQFFTEYSESAHSAALIRVRRDMLTLDAFRSDGTSLPSSFSKTKP